MSKTAKNLDEEPIKKTKGGKGMRTRAAILDATIECYNQYGYAKTTQEKIAERAGLSMGAITYHFSSIADITRAAITHAFNLRLERHEKAILTALDNPDDFDTALEIYWKELLDPLFVACHELAVASRTDPMLRAEFVPAQDRFQKRWNRNLLKLHPEWEETGDMFRFAVEYSTFLSEGMALHYMLMGGNEKRLHDIRDYMKDSLEGLQKLGKSDVGVKQMLAPGRARRADLARKAAGRKA